MWMEDKDCNKGWLDQNECYNKNLDLEKNKIKTPSL